MLNPCLNLIYLTSFYVYLPFYNNQIKITLQTKSLLRAAARSISESTVTKAGTMLESRFSAKSKAREYSEKSIFDTKGFDLLKTQIVK